MATKQLGYLYSDTLSNIGDAIRTKKNVTTKYTPTEMPEAILSIEPEETMPIITTISPGASTTVSAGYYKSDSTISASLADGEDEIDSSLKTAGSTQTIVPGGSATVSGGKYYTSSSTVNASLATATTQISDTIKESKTITASLTTATTVSPTTGKVLTGVTVNAPSTTGTATSSDILLDKTAWVNGTQVTGNISYYDGDTVLTPSTSNQTIDGGSYVDETITIVGVSSTNLPSTLLETKTVTAPITGSTSVLPTPGKVISSVTVNAPSTNGTATEADILADKTAWVNGVLLTGTYIEQKGTDTSDATATADDIISGKTAYISTGKATGTLSVINYYQGADEPDSSLGSINDLYVMIDLTMKITYNLTKVTSSNSVSSVNLDDSYTTTFTVSTDYEMNSVTITMGGTDITDTVYDEDTLTVTIPNVTGVVVITAKAIAQGSADAVGTLDDSSSSSYGQITLNDDLDADTYTLKYEDENNDPLTGWADITTITKS